MTAPVFVGRGAVDLLGGSQRVRRGQGHYVGAGSPRLLAANDGQFSKPISPRDLPRKNRIGGYTFLAFGGLLVVYGAARA